MSVITYPQYPDNPSGNGIDRAGYYRIESIAKAQKADLNNDIHPIFSAKNFYRDDKYIYRPALTRGLQLLTRLMEASLPFWHTVFFGEVVVLRPASESEGKCIRFINEVETLTADQKVRTRQSLEQLAERIMFDLDEDPKGCSSCEIRTHNDEDEERAFISLGITFYEKVENAHWDGTDIVKYSWLQTQIASTYGHELAHVAVLLARAEGDTRLSSFFGDSQVTEEGYEWENRIFGGILREVALPGGGNGADACYHSDGHPSAMTGMIALEDWPNFPRVASYKSKDWAIDVQGELPQVYIRWNTPITYFVNLLRTSWWETEYAQAGSRALRLHKMAGYRYVPDGKGSISSYNADEGAEEAAGLACSVPRGYEATADGLIVPRRCRWCRKMRDSRWSVCSHR